MQGFEQSAHESMHQLGFRFDELVVGGHRAPGIFTSLKSEL